MRPYPVVPVHQVVADLPVCFLRRRVLHSGQPFRLEAAERGIPLISVRFTGVDRSRRDNALRSAPKITTNRIRGGFRKRKILHAKAGRGAMLPSSERLIDLPSTQDIVAVQVH